MKRAQKKNTVAEIVVVKVTDPPLRLYDLLTRSGHELKEVRDFGHAKSILSECRNPALLIWGSNKDEESTELAQRLITSKEFINHTLILVGSNAARHHIELTKVYPVVAALDNTTALQEIVSVVNQAIEFAATHDAGPRTPSGRIEKVVKDKIFKSNAPLAQPILEQALAFSSGGKRLRGEDFVLSFHPDFFSRGELVPKNPRAKDYLDRLLLELPRPAREYVQRVAFVTDQFMQALEISEALNESARTAASLFADALKDRGELLRNDYLDSSETDLRSELVARYKRSARKIADETGDTEAAEILLSMSECIAGNELFDNQRALVASSIIASDIIARACWKSGKWNQTGIYSTLSKLRRPASVTLHPKVLSCVILFLAEASNSEASILLYPKLPPQIRERLKAFRTTCPVQVEAGEKVVPITGLAPGMCTSRPVYDCEGTTIVEANMALDFDLILRLWQLSAIKPLLMPVVVTKDAEAEPPVHDSHSTAHA